jgi:transcriptional regulator with GAF, ATPase, and Fis domain
MPADDDGAGVGPEERCGPAGTAAGIDSVDLSRGLLRVAAIPANADVLDAALRLVVALARVTVTGADGVSVCLRRHGALTTVAASDATVTGMDRDQYATGEGPCVAAATEGHWFHVESLDDELRWPAFIPLARDRGINSILSTPLLTQTRPMGALNIYSLRARAFAKPELELSSMLAARASDLLVSAAMDVSMEDLSRQLQEALMGRDVIAQARGVLMARHGVTADAAYTMLRRSSRQSSTPLRRVAEAVMASTQPPSGVTASDDA